MRKDATSTPLAPDLRISTTLLDAFTPEAAVEAAAFGAAAWPALHVTGTALYNSESHDWLAVLEAFDPAAVDGVAHGPLPHHAGRASPPGCPHLPYRQLASHLRQRSHRSGRPAILLNLTKHISRHQLTPLQRLQADHSIDP